MRVAITTGRQSKSGDPRFGLTGLFNGRLARFAGDRSGDVAIVFGLMAIVMFLAMGGAIDYSRWMNARTCSMPPSR